MLAYTPAYAKITIYFRIKTIFNCFGCPFLKHSDILFYTLFHWNIIFLDFLFFLFVYTQQLPSTLSLSTPGKGPNIYIYIYIYLCVCVFCISYSCLYICPSTFLQNHILHNLFMIRCEWLLDLIDYILNFMLFYMNWYKCSTSPYSGKHCLFPNSYILFFVSYNWKKKGCFA